MDNEVKNRALGNDELEFRRLWSFPCPACGLIAHLDERESRYICQQCGYVCGIDRRGFAEAQQQSSESSRGRRLFYAGRLL